MDIQQRIDNTPRNIMQARLKAKEFYAHNKHDAKQEAKAHRMVDVLERTPGENFKEIRENYQSNSPWYNLHAKKDLRALDDAALGVPLLESSLQEIKDNPDSSTAHFYKGWLVAGLDRQGLEMDHLEKVAENPLSLLNPKTLKELKDFQPIPEFTAYKDVFPFVNEWNIR